MVNHSSTSSGSSLARVAPALAVLLATVVAVGVWMFPERWVEPTQRQTTTRPQPGALAQSIWEPPAPKAWSALSEMLDALGEPPQQTVAIETPPPTDQDEDPVARPEELVVKQPPPPWSYEGFIEEPSGLVGLLRTRRGQRFVFIGETLTFDEGRGETYRYTVKRITPERLILQSGDFEHPLPIVRISPRTTPGRSGGGVSEPLTPRRGAAPPTERGDV